MSVRTSQRESWTRRQLLVNRKYVVRRWMACASRRREQSEPDESSDNGCCEGAPRESSPGSSPKEQRTCRCSEEGVCSYTQTVSRMMSSIINAKGSREETENALPTAGRINQKNRKSTANCRQEDRSRRTSRAAKVRERTLDCRVARRDRRAVRGMKQTAEMQMQLQKQCPKRRSTRLTACCTTSCSVSRPTSSMRGTRVPRSSSEMMTRRSTRSSATARECENEYN